MKWIRPVLSIIGYAAVIVGFFMGKIEPTAFFGLVTGTIIWWYKSRDEEKNKPNGGT